MQYYTLHPSFNTQRCSGCHKSFTWDKLIIIQQEFWEQYCHSCIDTEDIDNWNNLGIHDIDETDPDNAIIDKGQHVIMNNRLMMDVCDTRTIQGIEFVNNIDIFDIVTQKLLYCISIFPDGENQEYKQVLANIFSILIPK